MKLDLFQKIGIGLGTSFLLYILISTLFKKEVSLENIKYVEGEFESIKIFKPRNKWSVSYDIKIRDDETVYKIIPEYFDCFNHNLFNLNVSNKQIIRLGIDQDNGLKSNSSKSVVLIESERLSYIDGTCVNEKIKEDKRTLPLIFFGFLTLSTFVFFGNKYFAKGK